MLEVWCAAGLDYEQFGRLSMGEVVSVLRGRKAYMQSQVEQARALNFELAGLISHAVHQPRKMPKYRSVAEMAEQKSALEREPTEADHALIRAHLMRLVKGGR